MATSRKIIIAVLIILISSFAYAAENYFFTNFASGVLTRKLDARVDYEKFFSGARQLENFLVYPQGGVFKRPGSHYVAESGVTTTRSRLVPFEFSTEQAYILEFGVNFIRFFKDQGQITSGGLAYEVATTYSESELSELKFTQSADYLYIVHPNHVPAKLTRSGHTDWTLSDISFQSPATVEQNFYPASGVTPGNTSGSGVTFYANSGTFLAGDVGRNLKSSSSRAVITGYIDSSGVTCDILSNFTSTVQIAQNSWYLSGSPTGSLNPDDTPTTIGSIINLVNNQNAFRTTDIGDYVYIKDGLLEVTAFTNATTVKAEIIELLDDHLATSSWSLEGAAWDATNGYPETVQFFEQRLCWGGTATYPQTIWLSKSADFENLFSGSADDDGMSITIASSQVNAIRWMKEGQVLRIGTTGSEWTLGAWSSSEGITPSNVRLKQHTNHGSENIDALTVGRDVFHVQRGGRKVRNFNYNWEVDGYKSRDISLLAEHLFSGTTIVEMAYQKESNSIVWVLTADGNLQGLTWLDEQNIYAWHSHSTDGYIESIATIPGTNTDELWLVVKRNINGTDTRFIEYITDAEMDTVADAFYVDCGATYEGSGTTTITGLTYLSGETVSVLVNGAIHADVLVSGDTITLNTSGTTVHVGLPYTATLETIDLPTGTGITRRIPEIDIRFYKSAYGKWGADNASLDTIPFELSGTTPYTGDMQLNYPGGWEQDQTVLITSDEPLMLSVSGILVKYE